MSRAVIPSAVLFLLILPACDSGSVRPNAAEEIMALERAALDKWSSGDPLGYIDGWANDATYFDDIGAQSGIRGLDSMRSYLGAAVGKLQAHKYTLVEPSVQVYGNIGILTLQYHSATLEGAPLNVWKATIVYRHGGDRWRVVHAHWSVNKKAPQAA